jgi:hypothetical protein
VLSFLQHPSRINENSVRKRAEELQTFKLDGENLAAWLLRAVTFIDLTTLGGKKLKIDKIKLKEVA